MEDYFPAALLWGLVALVVAAGTALTVLAQYSFIRLRKEYVTELAAEDEEDRSEEWAKLLRWYQRPSRFLDTVQWLLVLLHGAFALSLCCSYLAAVRETETGDLLWPLYLLAVVLYWSLAVVLPKSAALWQPLYWLPLSGGWVNLLGKVSAPLLWCGESLAEMILRARGLSLTNELEVPRSDEEIRLLLHAGSWGEQLDEREGELIKKAFTFVDRLAREVMVPRQDMSVLYYGDDLETMRAAIRTSRHTRYPLCDGDKDHIVGLIHVKNFMELYVTGSRRLQDIVTEILVIPEVMPIVDLLQLMRTRRIYLAVVVDEFGGTVGLVALEDIIEELVGDIQDEHEAEAPEAVLELPDGRIEFDGDVILEEVTEHLDVEFEDVDADTIGGYVFALLERIPRVGDTVRVEDWEFRVDKLRGFRILRLTARKVPAEPSDE